MLLLGGLCRSSKEIHYDEQTKRFDIYNEIDDTYQSNLTEKALHTKTNIPEELSVIFCHNQKWSLLLPWGAIVGDIKKNKRYLTRRLYSPIPTKKRI
jgi:hypothetical protein